MTRASREFGPRRSTLHGQLSGCVLHDMKHSTKPYRDDDEEKELSTYLKHHVKVGYGKVRMDVVCIVKSPMGREVDFMRNMCQTDGGSDLRNITRSFLR